MKYHREVSSSSNIIELYICIFLTGIILLFGLRVIIIAFISFRYRKKRKRSSNITRKLTNTTKTKNPKTTKTPINSTIDSSTNEPSHLQFSIADNINNKQRKISHISSTISTEDEIKEISITNKLSSHESRSSISIAVDHISNVLSIPFQSNLNRKPNDDISPFFKYTAISSMVGFMSSCMINFAILILYILYFNPFILHLLTIFSAVFWFGGKFGLYLLFGGRLYFTFRDTFYKIEKWKANVLTLTFIIMCVSFIICMIGILFTQTSVIIVSSIIALIFDIFYSVCILRLFTIQLWKLALGSSQPLDVTHVNQPSTETYFSSFISKILNTRVITNDEKEIQKMYIINDLPLDIEQDMEIDLQEILPERDIMQLGPDIQEIKLENIKNNEIIDDEQRKITFTSRSTNPEISNMNESTITCTPLNIPSNYSRSVTVTPSIDISPIIQLQTPPRKSNVSERHLSTDSINHAFPFQLTSKPSNSELPEISQIILHLNTEQKCNSSTNSPHLKQPKSISIKSNNFLCQPSSHLRNRSRSGSTISNTTINYLVEEQHLHNVKLIETMARYTLLVFVAVISSVFLIILATIFSIIHIANIDDVFWWTLVFLSLDAVINCYCIFLKFSFARDHYQYMCGCIDRCIVRQMDIKVTHALTISTKQELIEQKLNQQKMMQLQFSGLVSGQQFGNNRVRKRGSIIAGSTSTSPLMLHHKILSQNISSVVDANVDEKYVFDKPVISLQSGIIEEEEEDNLS